jgi:BirA family transcriptional regulator, biotin operon repressor / biotin---[acetyl-CoA-carboxylase] ligase
LYKIPAKTVFMGKNLIFMPECHSTNTFSLNLCQQPSKPADGSVVITANQTAGRGQRGNTWIVEPGKNLTFSLILYPTFILPTEQFQLQVFMSLGVRDYLTGRNVKGVKIKWPNDILVGDKKICGMLVENQIMGNRITACVAGIGLNINQRTFDIEGPTSLGLESDSVYDLNDELHQLLQCLEIRYLQLRQRSITSIFEEYTRNLYWLEEVREFESPARGVFEGRILGVEPTGMLKILVAGNEEYFAMKEISHHRANSRHDSF